ncbi:MAG: hypothetical protein ACYDGN_04835 [Acidimicrobiales bacterium]
MNTESDGAIADGIDELESLAAAAAVAAQASAPEMPDGQAPAHEPQSELDVHTDPEEVVTEADRALAQLQADIGLSSSEPL